MELNATASFKLRSKRREHDTCLPSVIYWNQYVLHSGGGGMAEFSGWPGGPPTANVPSQCASVIDTAQSDLNRPLTMPSIFVHLAELIV